MNGVRATRGSWLPPGLPHITTGAFADFDMSLGGSSEVEEAARWEAVSGHGITRAYSGGRNASVKK